MTRPFSLRMDDDTHEELVEHAERLDVNASKLVNRYVKEGLRMDEHPAVIFRTTSLGRRAAVLASHPGLQVIDVIGTWRAERQDVAKTARYLHISEEDVQAVLRYYAEYRDEVDRDLREHLDAQQNYKRVLARREAQAGRRLAKA
ncbi:MAG: hypothetical protein HYU87_02415 [Chloroflexi bacterium]|nr:hypothetical protein [Chloroflexota bacterium]